MPILRIVDIPRVILGLLLAVSQAAPAGAVLCVAGDDHSVIEAVASARCHPKRTTEGVAARSVADDGCPSDCKDTPLNEGTAIRSIDGTASAFAAASLPAPFSVFDAVSLHRSLALDLRFAQRLPAVRHSIVLRC